ncbi:MAG: hypothetical protein H6741_24905 [Alphaproteobacteria bacterium]|nr:hypothetical protein [Alphaproteobacteria bacterium]MCB9795948.1 hypothetical protein [Alphaproteobacteria bacterium]
MSHAGLILALGAIALLSGALLFAGLIWQWSRPQLQVLKEPPALPEPLPPEIEAELDGVAGPGRLLTSPPVAQPGGLVVDGVRAHLDWVEGRDLKAYPERLGELIEQLLLGHRAAQEQLQTLALREAELSAKPGREDLARRYRQDQAALQQRAGAMRRVMGSVWRTRATLLLRVQLAVAARRRPALTGLPAPAEVPAEGLDAAATSYAAAAQEVRVFLRELDEARAELDEQIDAPPPSAELSAEDQAAVAAEQAQVSAKLSGVRERMDALADTLTYLADRMRTQAVVAGAGLSMDVEPEAGRLLEEVAEALRRLDGLSEVGDRALADAAMTGLSHDITELEREGMEVDAEAKAGLEVERLLRQFEVG